MRSSQKIGLSWGVHEPAGRPEQGPDGSDTP